MAKLLVITNNPDRPSFRQRIAIHTEALQQQGIQCELAEFPGSACARRKLFKQAAAFNAVLLQKKTLNLLNAGHLRRYSKKIIYDYDDAVMYSPKHPERNSFSHFRAFRRTVSLADLVIAGCPYLVEKAKRFNKNVRLLPTGLDTREYQFPPQRKQDDKIRLVWIGSKSNLAYLAQLKPILEQVGVCFNNVVLRIICDDFFDLQNMKVEKHHWSLQTQAADLAACDIGLSPLPDNPFTKGKCGFKILQYAAAGLPVVASPVGVNTRYVRHNHNGFLAAEHQEWTNSITDLIQDKQRRKTIGRKNQLRLKKFDADKIGKKLNRLIAELLESEHS